MSEPDKRVVKTYVWHGEQCFFVSTIERDSSAMDGPRRFNETIIWKYDWDNRKCANDIFAMTSDARGSIFNHNRTVQQLFRNGKVSDED